MIRTLVSVPAVLLLIAAGCGNDLGNQTDSATSGTDTGETGTEGGSSSTGEPEVPFEPVLALGGLELDWVEANQGVGVAIGRDGAGVGGAERSTYLIQDRVTLIRAFWKDPPADWVPRKIEGRLIVTYPDGSELVRKNSPMIDGPSFIGDLKRSFYWGLMREEVVPGIKYRIELWETEAGFKALPEGTEPGAVEPKIPLKGNAYVGIEDSTQVMKVTLVPFNYNNQKGCKTQPDTSPETMQRFQDYMYMMNPLDDLQFTLHEPIDWPPADWPAGEAELTDFNELNAYMSMRLREDEGAPANMYYFGLVDVCSGGLGDAGGKAYGIPTGARMEDAWQRVSSGLSLDVDWSAETFVHEVGHSQGRFHIKCQGEAGTDDTYPNEGGVIGEWGFGVLNFSLYHPTVHKDYMTYCHPVWASTFGWNKTFPTIKELSSWDAAGAPAPANLGPILVGTIDPDGKKIWATTRGGIDPAMISAVHSIEFQAGGALLSSQPAAYIPHPDSDTYLVVVPLPPDFDKVTQIVHVEGDFRTPVGAKSIIRNHPIVAR